MSDNKLLDEVFKKSDSLNEMKNEVIEFNNSLLKLAKISNLSANELKKVTNEAYKLGNSVTKSGSKVIEMITSFKQAGYNISDSMRYAKEALLTTNISATLNDTEQAASTLISIMKDFKNETPDFAKKINDSISAVSGNGIIDYDKLIEGTLQLSATANQAGMSFEQMLGTLTGVYEILGDMDETVSGQTEIFSRLQGTSLDGSNISSIPELQNIFSDSTNGAVNIIDQKTNQLRNVYDILDDLNSVWNTLNKSTQNTLAFEVAGIENENVFLALMQNWNGVEKSVNSATNSFGSAEIANDKYLNSIQGKMEKFQSAFQSLSQHTLDSSILKGILDFGTVTISTIDKISAKIGPLTSLMAGLSVALSTKNLGREKGYPSYQICRE